MKRFLIILLALLVAICTSACAEGESDMLFNSDRKIANKSFEEIFEALEANDADKLKSLFSKESINATEGFDAQIGDLFDYYNGEIESYDDWGGPTVETSCEGFLVHQVMESTYDVKTTEGTYRVAIQAVTRDSTNSNNLGIKSLYIIRYEDDLLPQYAYWGDGKFAPGISIGIPNFE